jgi:hypothetical protein
MDFLASWRIKGGRGLNLCHCKTRLRRTVLEFDDINWKISCGLWRINGD